MLYQKFDGKEISSNIIQQGDQTGLTCWINV